MPELHVEAVGEGSTLLLGHGFGGSARNFRPQARALSDLCRVVTFDARGHARSEAPGAAEDYAPTCFVSDVARVLDGEGVSRAFVGGLSMGAGIALRFAFEHVERVQGLVLAAFPAPADDSRRQWAMDFADAIEARGVDTAGAEYVWGARSRFDPAGARLIRQGFLEHPGHALAHTLRQLIAGQPSVEEMHDQLQRLDVPGLVIVGSEDRLSLGASRDLAASLARAELHVIEGAGHVVNLAAPGAFNARVRRFIAESC